MVVDSFRILAESKVQYFDGVLRCDHDILRLDVSMDHIFGVTV